MSVRIDTLRTKIVWSFTHDIIDEKLASKVIDKREQFDALRLVYYPNISNKINDFLQTMRSLPGGDSLSIILDVALKIRATTVSDTEPRAIAPKDKIRFAPRSTGNAKEIVVKTSEWDELFYPGCTVYIGTDNVMLRCLEVKKNQTMVAEVLRGEQILPDATLRIPETQKNIHADELVTEEIKGFLKYDLDFIVIPGITDSQEISKVRALLHTDTADKVSPWLLLKADTIGIYQKLPEIIKAVDGILISRRELALTTNPATIPMIAKEIKHICSEHAKIILTASELLGSMRYSPTPTRAEISDIANAVIDGTDAIVLPEDLYTGDFFQQAVDTACKVINEVEKDLIEPVWSSSTTIKNEHDALAIAACNTANRIQAKAIVCFSRSGVTAMRLSRYRSFIPIIAVTFDKQIQKRMSLMKGVKSISLATMPILDKVLAMVNEQLKISGYLSMGDSYIFLNINLSPISPVASNLFSVQSIV